MKSRMCVTAAVRALSANYLSRREIFRDGVLRSPTCTSPGIEKVASAFRIRLELRTRITLKFVRSDGMCVCVCVLRCSEGSEDEMSGRCKAHAAVCAYVSLCERGFLVLVFSFSLPTAPKMHVR